MYSFLASRPRSPLKLCGDQSITRSFEPSSRNGIIVLSSTTPSCHLLPPPSSFLCLPPRLAYLFILNRFYSQDIYYIISTIIFASRPEVCINRAWREDLLYPSPLSLFLFLFSGEDARVYTHHSGRIRKNRLIHYHCNDGLTRGRGGGRKNGHGTDDCLEEEGEEGEKRRFFFWARWRSMEPRDDYSLVICTRSTRTMTDQLRFRDSLSRFQPVKPRRGATDRA